MVMNWKRLFAHLLMPSRHVHRHFNEQALQRIETAITDSESRHSAEIVVAIESALEIALLLRNQSARERAIDVFSALRVWDTELNNGVLLYVLLADHDIEIVADRGLNKHISADDWEKICQQIEQDFRRGEFADGIIHGLESLTQLLSEHYPSDDTKANHLSNRPVIF